MADYLDNYADIVFLDSELEDDDDNAPVGELIEVVDGKVRIAEKKEPAPQTAESAPEEKEEAPSPAAPDETPVVQQLPVFPAAAAEEQPEAKDGECTAQENADAADELPAPDPVYLYPYGITPADNSAAEEVPSAANGEKISSPAEEAEETAEPAAEAAPVAEEVPAAPAENYDVTESVPVAAEPVREEAAEKETPSKKAKPVSHLIIQSAADDGNVWGNAVIKPTKKAEKKPEKAEESAAADTVNAEKAEAPAAVKKKGAASANKSTETAKEENKVAKTKAASEDAKKDTKKAAAKPAAKKETAPKAEAKPAAKKETAAKSDAAKTAAKKADAKAAPAAKTAAAKPAKEETKKPETREQVIEEGDASTPHGKFVIKKTDKGNFVYKLYSSNYRVVAIGAGLYTSIASCKTGINSVRNNAATAPIEDQTLQKWEELKFPKWQIYTDKQGEIRLRLLAANGNIVATTNDGYLSKEAAKKGIAAIARAAKGSEIVRNDDLW